MYFLILFCQNNGKSIHEISKKFETIKFCFSIDYLITNISQSYDNDNNVQCVVFDSLLFFIDFMGFIGSSHFINIVHNITDDDKWHYLSYIKNWFTELGLVGIIYNKNRDYCYDYDTCYNHTKNNFISIEEYNVIDIDNIFIKFKESTYFHNMPKSINQKDIVVFVEENIDTLYKIVNT